MSQISLMLIEHNFYMEYKFPLQDFHYPDFYHPDFYCPDLHYLDFPMSVISYAIQLLHLIGYVCMKNYVQYLTTYIHIWYIFNDKKLKMFTEPFFTFWIHAFCRLILIVAQVHVTSKMRIRTDFFLKQKLNARSIYGLNFSTNFNSVIKKKSIRLPTISTLQ